MTPVLPLASVDQDAATALVLDAYALHAGHVDDIAAIAAIADVSPDVVERMLADPRGLVKLNAAATKAEAEGKTLAPYARHIRLKLLRAVEETVDKGVDGFEAVELDKLIERVVVQDERVKAAQKDPYANLPVINVQIIHGNITAELVKPGTPMADAVDVVDVVASEPEGRMSLRDRFKSGSGVVALTPPEDIRLGGVVLASEHKALDGADPVHSFYARLLPQGGNYILFQNKQHSYHATLDDLVKATMVRIDTQGLYFATASFGDAKNRTQSNVRKLRAYRMDLDAGATKLEKHGPSKVYATQKDAVADVIRAVKAGLPVPSLIVSSGEGLHVYWVLKEDIDPEPWNATATALQAVGQGFGLLIDTSVTCDTARILRPVGTLHPNGSRVSIIKDTGVTYSQGEFDRMLSEQAPTAALAFPLSMPNAVRDINSDVLDYKGPPASLARVAEHCGAVAELRDTNGNIPEPQWRAVIGIAKYCEDGEQLVHVWSEGHPDYSHGETQAKLDRWETQPTTCKHFATMTDACKTCTHAGKITTPKQLGIEPAAPVSPNSSGVVAHPSRAMLKQALPDWTRTQDGEKVRPQNTTDNLNALATLCGARIRYNVMTRKTEITIPGMKSERDDFDNAALAKFGDSAIRAGMNRDGIKELADAVAGQNPYHPVLQYIEAKPWDGTTRLRMLFSSLELVDPAHAATRDALLTAWALQCIGALLDADGVAAQGVLVLNGPQDINKTRWVANLCPIAGAVRTGLHLNPQDKDSVFQATCAWVTELGEMDSTVRKSDVSALKAFLTRSLDILRRPYALTDNSYRRRTVFAGTVNGTGFLTDETGDRRFWVIAVKFCHLIPAEDMQQIWAELLVKYQAGERWHLSAETKAALNASNAPHRVIDPIQERIMTKFDWEQAAMPAWPKLQGTRWITATDICIEIGIPHPTKSEATRAGTVVADLNGRVTRKSNGAKLHAVPPLGKRAP